MIRTSQQRSSRHSAATTNSSAATPVPSLLNSYFYAVGFEPADGIAAFAAFLARARPDILVNNTGINIPGQTDTFVVDNFDRLYSVNLRTPFLLCQAVMSSMKARSWGRIVNITSLRSRIGKAGDAPPA
jgi:NAD(P)-dependent dehydrogenase (short-subunit alcohol dehydrogenase family)